MDRLIRDDFKKKITSRTTGAGGCKFVTSFEHFDLY